MIRNEAAMPVSRFCGLVGIPRRTYCRLQFRERSGKTVEKGPWPAPSMDMVECLLAEYVLEHPTYGYRRIHQLMVADGHVTSQSTVLRAMRKMGAVTGGDQR